MSPIGKLIPMHRRFHSRGWTALPQFEIAFLPFDAQGLRAQILNSPHLRDNPLNDLFDGSKGIYFNFAAQGPAYERFQAACPWLDAMYRQMRHHPQANAFVLNALVLPVGTPAQAHYDSTLGTWPVGVNVLYVDIPEDMEGGELELYSTAVHKYVPGRKPLQRVRPQVGMLCRFRGDMFHKVNSMKRGSRPRISLVLEEYVLADPTRVAMGG